MAPVQIALFSSFEATRDGQPIPGLTSSKIQALLAYLALEADRAHPRETLAALLWPDHSGHNAMQNLRQSLSRLQRALEVPDLLLLDGQALQLVMLQKMHQHACSLYLTALIMKKVT